MPRKKRRRITSQRAKVRSVRGTRSPRRCSMKGKGKKAYRDIINDGVTYSFLSEFLGCREQARLSYIEGYTQAGICDPLEFGSLFHACCEASAEGGNSPIKSYQVTADYVLQKKKYDKLSKREVGDLEFLARVVSVMYPLYFDHWRKGDGLEFQGNTKFVAQELPFNIKHKLPSGNVIPIRGRFDAILRKGFTGKLWLMETKTKSQIDHEGITSALSSMDLQTMLYCYCIREHFGEMPEGVLYNVIRRPALRQKQTETTDEFLARIQDDVASRPNDYFFRWHVSILEKGLLDWVSRSLDPILEQVWQWWDSIKDNPFDPWTTKDGKRNTNHFVNPEGIYTRYGRSRYFDMLTRGVPVGLKQRTIYSPPEKKGKARKKKGSKT